MFSEDELTRYSRQIQMPEVGGDGQAKLKAAGVLIVGAGGLGSPAAMYLAAAGVGRIGLIDADMVELSNLHRQLLHGTDDMGRPKVDSAAETLKGINPHVRVDLYMERLTAANAGAIVPQYHVLVDGSDNFQTRYLTNDACFLLSRPLIYASVFRFTGQVTVFSGKQGPCYRCIYPEPPPQGEVPNCAEAGVLGLLPGIMGLLQATEAVKLILGIGKPLIGRMVLFDALAMRFQEIAIDRDPNCPLCGVEPTIKEVADENRMCEAESEQRMRGVPEVNVREFSAMRERGDPHVLLDVRDPHELKISRLGNELHIPVSEIGRRLAEIDREAEIVVICQTGHRSATVTMFLLGQGYPKVRNLVGGINAWATEIDPSMQTY
jgi:molybdopterin/thiamine biosynthesis adenylyltransferase/rhodanese-related sulfurtransferase